MMTYPSDPQIRQRSHAERMLARAERRSRQALTLVEKWQARLAALDREGVAARQAKLWADDQPEQGTEGCSPQLRHKQLSTSSKS